MKTKVFLTSFALAALFAGCSEDEFTVNNAGEATDQSGMIELGENFMIGAAGVDDPATRTHWEFNDKNGLTNVYMPIAVTSGGNNVIAVKGSGSQAVLAPAIGLCWLGQTPGDQVYTNYEFFHNGWLGKGQEKAVFDPCDDAVLTNGWLYSDLQLSKAGTEGKEVTADGAAFTEFKGGKVSAVDGKTALNLAEMNLNSGVYKTCNKAIFGGQYIAYYPYNAEFINAGTIPAKSQVVFNTLTENDATNLEIAENTFRYSNVAEIDGGDMAKGFGFNNLSGIVRVILKNTENKIVKANEAKITKVMLYSPSSSFLKEVRLSASKIAAKATGTALYAETVETSKTIVANLAENNYMGLAAANATNAEAIKKEKGILYLTALPTTVKDLVVLAQNADGKWAEAEVGEVTIKAGQGVNVVATMGEFKDVYYAVDKATLKAAITKIGTTPTEDKPATIEVLGDIELTADKEGTAGEIEIPSWTIVTGDKLIVSEDMTLRLKDNATAKCDIVVEGQACCTDSKAAGKLAVNGATIDGDLTVKAGGAQGKAAGSVTFGGNVGVATVTANSVVTSDGEISVLRNVDVFGNVTLNETGVIDVRGTSGDLNVKGGKLVNNGTIEVEGKFAILDAQGVTVPDAGENFTNNGKFIDNVGATIGGATQYMVFGEKGQYICKVNSQTRLDEAYVNKTACNVIQFIGGVTKGYDFTKADKHNDEYVDIVVDATDVKFAPTENVEIGNLSVNAGMDLTINESAALEDAEGNPTGEYAAITVKGNITLSGKFETAVDVRNMVADNLTVLNGGTAKFGNRRLSQDTTLKVLGTIENQKGGTFEITPKGTDTNVAYVTCTKLVEGGSFTGKPEVVK